jgi:hypothetical protein
MKCIAVVTFTTLFASHCSTGNSCDTSFEQDFSQGAPSWVAGLSDYTAANQPADATWSVDALPSPTSGTGYHLSLTNTSQDAIIWAKKRFTGLQPGVTYSFDADVTLVTNTSTGCADAAGATGADTHLVMLADVNEPSTLLLADGTYRLNSDTLSGTTLTRAITDLGSIAVGTGDCSHLAYASKEVTGSLQQTVVAPDDGGVWLLIGVDAKYAGKVDVFFQNVKVSALAAEE